ncbi:MAG: heme-binding domain-containing protein [Chloroflexi bacterium]|nr:heme-binding domain-containing protein [Chloroflexota bacterium]
MSKRKIFWSILGVIVVVVVGIQLIPYGRNHTNPPVVTEPQWDSPRTRELFTRACADCHSNETIWPWYSNLAPVSWLVQRDVDEGREKFNISVAGSEGDEAAEKVSEGEMPPLQYTLLHPAANLAASEKQELIQGLLATFGGESSERE